MKRFRFSLQPVLELRERAERQALQILGQARVELEASKITKKEMRAATSKSYDRRAVLASRGQTVSQLQMEDEFITGQKVREEHQDRLILRWQKKVDSAARQVLQARRAKETLVKIKEEQFRRYQLEMRREEAKALDELYILRSAQVSGIAKEEGEEEAHDEQ